MEATLETIEVPEVRDEHERCLIRLLDGDDEKKGYVRIYQEATDFDKTCILKQAYEAIKNLSDGRAQEFTDYFERRIGLR